MSKNTDVEIGVGAMPSGAHSPTRVVAMPTPRRASSLAHVISVINTFGEEYLFVDEEISVVCSRPVNPSPKVPTVPSRKDFVELRDRQKYHSPSRTTPRAHACSF